MSRCLVGNGSSDNPSSPTTTSSSSSSTGDSAEVVDQLSSMMEVMMQNPAMQQLLLSRLPPHMQRPEALRAMMANQEVRARIAAIAQQSVSAVGCESRSAKGGSQWCGAAHLLH